MASTFFLCSSTVNWEFSSASTKGLYIEHDCPFELVILPQRFQPRVFILFLFLWSLLFLKGLFPTGAAEAGLLSMVGDGSSLNCRTTFYTFKIKGFEFLR
jgi:hypothetical protein